MAFYSRKLRERYTSLLQLHARQPQVGEVSSLLVLLLVRLFLPLLVFFSYPLNTMLIHVATLFKHLFTEVDRQLFGITSTAHCDIRHCWLPTKLRQQIYLGQTCS